MRHCIRPIYRKMWARRRKIILRRWCHSHRVQTLPQWVLFLLLLEANRVLRWVTLSVYIHWWESTNNLCRLSLARQWAIPIFLCSRSSALSKTSHCTSTERCTYSRAQRSICSRQRILNKRLFKTIVGRRNTWRERFFLFIICILITTLEWFIASSFLPTMIRTVVVTTSHTFHDRIFISSMLLIGAKVTWVQIRIQGGVTPQGTHHEQDNVDKLHTGNLFARKTRQQSNQISSQSPTPGLNTL